MSAEVTSIDESCDRDECQCREAIAAGVPVAHYRELGPDPDEREEDH